MQEIIDIKCPYCKDVYLFKRRYSDGDFKWHCPTCVYVYSSSWFNEFPQFEKFVTRKN